MTGNHLPLARLLFDLILFPKAILTCMPSRRLPGRLNSSLSDWHFVESPAIIIWDCWGKNMIFVVWQIIRFGSEDTGYVYHRHNAMSTQFGTFTECVTFFFLCCNICVMFTVSKVLINYEKLQALHDSLPLNFRKN